MIGSTSVRTSICFCSHVEEYSMFDAEHSKCIGDSIAAKYSRSRRTFETRDNAVFPPDYSEMFECSSPRSVSGTPWIIHFSSIGIARHLLKCCESWVANPMSLRCNIPFNRRYSTVSLRFLIIIWMWVISKISTVRISFDMNALRIGKSLFSSESIPMSNNRPDILSVEVGGWGLEHGTEKCGAD